MQRRRAFVIGAYIPNGGTLIAYHLGRILQLDFGFEAVAVQVGTETAATSLFRYDPEFSSMTIAQMESEITDHDVLVCTPSFSPRMFGFRLPGRKICYVLGFNTFKLLDCRFDLYVAGSEFLLRFLSAVYGLTPRVIPLFVNIDDLPPAPAWWSRPPGSTLVSVKGDKAMIEPLLDRLNDILSSRAPDIKLEHIPGAPTLLQMELMRRFGSYRHFLVLSAAEGFGLMPLEAMAMGTTVIGFDGYGGRQYMRPGVNCAVAAYPDIESVADNLIKVTRSPELGARLAQAGRATAESYSYAKFRAAWIEELSRFLDKKPIAPELSIGSA
jgi:hypothetical protein